jgi:hypothetical protein
LAVANGIRRSADRLVVVTEIFAKETDPRFLFGFFWFLGLIGYVTLFARSAPEGEVGIVRVNGGSGARAEAILRGLR